MLTRLVLAAAFLVAASVTSSALGVVVAGPERLLFAQARDGCDIHDLPDAPARAFRNATGAMVLFAPNYQNRALVGADLAHLKRDCAVRFAASGRALPSLLDDRTWLQAFHTDDGRDVFAFASASFIPYRHDMPCAAGKARTDCWYNGIAALSSTDGGATFGYLGTPPQQIAFPPPAPYDPNVANPAGFMTATNIITWRGALYTILWRRVEDGKSHNCLARADADEPLRWQLWSGKEFVPAATFTGSAWSIATTDCAAVGPTTQPVIRSVVLHEAGQTFIAVFQSRIRGQPGFYYATSRDLVRWSAPALLLAVDLKADAGPGESYAGYPSIIDDTSADRNFGTVGATASLVFVRVKPVGQRSVLRDLVALPLRIMN
ncbi:MAG TPA: hypothetical protein VHA70_06690 [Bauldia sp.]|nr:hypothetical protein [Bauldia sp.]